MTKEKSQAELEIDALAKDLQIKIAVSFKVIKSKIALFDKDGNSLSGDGIKWEGNFNCSNNPGLTSLEGAPESVGGGFNCYNNPGLTSLEGAPESVGGWFDCYNNPGLTSLEGAPESVGGWFNCYNNPGLTSLEGAPEKNKPQFSRFLARGLVFYDGILTKKISIKVKLGITIYKTSRLGFKKKAPIVYVCTKGDISAHGKTAKEAVAELEFKIGSRDVGKYRDMPLSTKKSPQEWGLVYRLITGACQYGVQQFMESKGDLKKTYTLKEIMQITTGAYGHESFKNIVMGKVA